MIRTGRHHPWNRALGLAAALLLSAGAAGAVEPPYAVDLHITAPVGADDVGVDLTAGVAADATGAFDPRYDSRALPVGSLQAWFAHPEAPVYAERLATDVRSGAVAEVWTIEVATPDSPLGTVAGGADVTVAWDTPRHGGGVCEARPLTLVDVTGGGAPIDMTAAAGLTLPAPGPGGVHVLELAIGAAGTAGGAAPEAPARLMSPRATRRGVLLIWTPVKNAAGYHVERLDNPGSGATNYVRITKKPVSGNRHLDKEAVGLENALYRVVAVSGAGCESAPSEPLAVTP